jgi:hypothetical protein
MRVLRNLGTVAVTAVVAVSGVTLWGGPAQGAARAGSADKIHNALSAAPAAVARKATVMDWAAHEGESMPVLRKGSNGWTCMPNDPMTPTNDPQCMNANAMKWMDAWMDHKAPKLTGPGLSYVLQGCTVASNTDPFAMAPPKGKRWIPTGPHIMVFSPQKLDRKVYGTSPSSGLPYVRWAGTPYEHLVVPVPAPMDSMHPMPMDDMGGMGGH